jgi:hypothetical protein
MKYFWKVWLKPNLLTPNVDNDYIAEVSTIGNTLHNEDIANCIIAEGSEIKYDTLVSILNQNDRNDPKKVIVRVPFFNQGEYTLRIVTRFSNSTVLLKAPCTIEYATLLMIP